MATNPNTATLSAALYGNAAATRRLCGLLVAKGVLSQAEAASVFTEAAREVREATEDDGGTKAASGEVVAKLFEQQAHWLLGYPGVLGQKP